MEAELNDYEVLGVDGGKRQRATAKVTATGATRLQTPSDSISSSTVRGGGGGSSNGQTDVEETTVADSSGGGGVGIRTRTSNNDWEEYADLIEDTDDLK